MSKKVLLLLVISTLISCGESRPLDNEVGPAPIWKLVSFGANEGDQTLAISGTPFTYQFDLTADGEIKALNGFDGCNFYGTQDVAVDASTNTPTLIPTTGIDIEPEICGDLQFEAYLTQLDYFYSVISSSHTFDIGDLSLTLESPAGRILFFRACKETNAIFLDTDCALATRLPDLTVAARSPLRHRG